MVRMFGGHLRSSDRTYLNSGVQEVDPLGNFQITSGRVIEGLKIGIRLKRSGWIVESVFRVTSLE